jgi:hypothetical protein
LTDEAGADPTRIASEYSVADARRYCGSSVRLIIARRAATGTQRTVGALAIYFSLTITGFYTTVSLAEAAGEVRMSPRQKKPVKWRETI